MPDQCYYLLVNMKLVWVIILMYYIKWGDFPGGPAVKNPPCNAGDVGSILRSHMPQSN